MLRRNFIKQTSVGVFVIGLLSSLPLFNRNNASSKGKESAPKVDKRSFAFIYDDRFREAKAFKKEAKKQKLTTYGMSGDITDIWYQKLRTHWEKGSKPVTGLTTPTSLFLLSQMAKDHGKKVTKQKVINSDLIHWTIS